MMIRIVVVVAMTIVIEIEIEVVETVEIEIVEIEEVVEIEVAVVREGRKKEEDKKKVVEKEPRWGKAEEYEEEEKTTVQEVEKANFGLTGNLMADEDTGTVVNGVVLKWSEPPEARKPSTKWRLYVFKERNFMTSYAFIVSHRLIGREKRVADIPAYHPSISSQHAVIQFRQIEKPGKMGQSKFVVRPYLMDLDSTNGTTLNKTKISSARRVELRERRFDQFWTFDKGLCFN